MASKNPMVEQCNIANKAFANIESAFKAAKVKQDEGIYTYIARLSVESIYKHARIVKVEADAAASQGLNLLINNNSAENSDLLSKINEFVRKVAIKLIHIEDILHEMEVMDSMYGSVDTKGAAGLRFKY